MTIQMHTAMNQIQPLSGDLCTGHMTSSCMTSSQVTKTFTSITPHRIEIEPWARCHCVFLVKTHRMYAIWPTWDICQVRSFAWLKVKFSNWPFEVKMHMFRCVLTRGIRWCFAFFSFFLSSKVIRKKTWSSQKATFFVWPALGRSKCDLR